MSFDTNGGEPIDDLQTDENFQVTLPTPAREGFEFLGWYYSGEATPAGRTVDVVQNCTYVAGWKRIDPSAGLTSLSASKQTLDLYAANGSVYQIVDGLDNITYFPEEDKYVHASSASVVVTPAVSDGVTNVQVVASSTGGKWATPFVHPRLPGGIKLSDIYEVQIPYSYKGSNANVIGKPLVFFYKIGSTWRHLEGDMAFAATEEGRANTIRVKVGESLGAEYGPLKDKTISDWKFYFYGGTVTSTGFGNTGWNIGGTFVFYPLTLAKQSGLLLLVR